MGIITSSITYPAEKMQMGRQFLRKNIEFAKHATKNSVGDVFNQPKTSTGPVCIFPEECSPIGSAVAGILRDGQTDTRTDFVL